MSDRSPHTMAVCPSCDHPTVSTEVGTGRCWSCAVTFHRPVPLTVRRAA